MRNNCDQGACMEGKITLSKLNTKIPLLKVLMDIYMELEDMNVNRSFDQ